MPEPGFTHLPLINKLIPLSFVWGLANLILVWLAVRFGQEGNVGLYVMAGATFVGAAVFGMAFAFSPGWTMVLRRGSGYSSWSFGGWWRGRDWRALSLAFATLLITWYVLPRGNAEAAGILTFATAVLSLILLALTRRVPPEEIEAGPSA